LQSKDIAECFGRVLPRVQVIAFDYGRNLNRSICNPTTTWAAQSIANRHPMTAPIMISRNTLWLALALSPLSLGITDAAGADAQVYKCTQPNGTALYTDRACNGGTQVDIRLGPVDPAAPARLAHAQAELDTAAAQQRAGEEIAASRREELNRLQLEAEAADQAPPAPLADYPYENYGPYGTGYGPYREHRPRRGSPSKQYEDTRPDEARVPAIVRGPASRMDAR
jgi:hypothetical protein